MKTKKKIKTINVSTALARYDGGLVDLSPEAVKSFAEAGGGQGAGFLKIAQATSEVTTSGRAKLGDVLIGDTIIAKAGEKFRLAPIQASYRAQLWGKGKKQGQKLAESCIKGSEAWQRCEASRDGEFGYEFLAFEVGSRRYAIVGFGKYNNRKFGDMMALQFKSGGSMTFQTIVKPGKPGRTAFAQLNLLNEPETPFTLPKNAEAQAKAYVEKVKAAQQEERESEDEEEVDSPER